MLVDNVDLRAEVGLLSRRIVVQGDSSSDQSKFGGISAMCCRVYSFQLT